MTYILQCICHILSNLNKLQYSNEPNLSNKTQPSSIFSCKINYPTMILSHLTFWIIHGESRWWSPCFLHIPLIWSNVGKASGGSEMKANQERYGSLNLNPDLSELLVKGNSHRLHCVCVAGGRSGNVTAQTMLTCEKSGTQCSKNSIKKQTCSSLIKLQSLLQMAPSTNTGIRLPDTTSSRNFGDIQIEEVCESAIL